MISRLLCLTALLCAQQAIAKAVFAHFMVSNSVAWSVSQWNAEIQLAKSSAIDAFALNMASKDNYASSVANAFTAAQQVGGFSLFFSFDYAGSGPWDKATVISLINKYSGNSAYFHFNGKPLVSTFEGPGNAADWPNIKSSTGCVFIPDWSSLGAKKAMDTGVVDGLFSWAAWAWGGQDMDTYTDESFKQYLGGKPYMMGVSPWFYTNLPKFKKNWMWRSDHLWFDRWQQVMFEQPDLVEIITWNDYGESHYIGPLRSEVDGLFTSWNAPFNYAKNMPHDAWRLFLPYLITLYKKGTASINQEGIQSWYRVNPSNCDANGTTVNTALQFQVEFAPADVVKDKVFFSALLASSASVTVTVGGTTINGAWSSIPDGGVGIYHGSVDLSGAGGNVQISLTRNGKVIAAINGAAIANTCSTFANYNPWVGGALASSKLPQPVSPPRLLSQQNCTSGFGAFNFNDLCQFTCKHGYCPPSCVCTNMGLPSSPGKPTGQPGYPANGDDNYAGLCSFACNYGYCPKECASTRQSSFVPSISPFLPAACSAGAGLQDDVSNLCTWACQYGFCPRSTCACSHVSALNTDLPPDTGSTNGQSAPWQDPNRLDKLCGFTCRFGECPQDLCYDPDDVTAGGDDDDDEDDDEYNFPPVNPNYFLPCNATFTDLDDFSSKAGSVPPYCVSKYLVDVLIAEWGNTNSQFNSLIQNGYDSKFDAYQQYMRDTIPGAINGFMNDRANDFFTCTTNRICCRACSTACSPCISDSSCTGQYGNINVQCPNNWNGTAGDFSSADTFPNTTFTLRDSDGFFKAITDATGVEKDWINLSNVLVETANGCQGAGSNVNTCEQQNGNWFYGYPVAGSITITNPKDTFIQSQNGSQTLMADLIRIQRIAAIDPFILMDDVVDSTSMPALAAVAAIDAMQKLTQIGKQIQEEEKKEFILNFVSGLLFWLPFIGEALGPELAAISTAIRVVDVAGNAALGIYGAVEDPSSTVSAIFGILFSLPFDRVKWIKIASKLRGISAGELDGLGLIKEKLATIKKTKLNQCRAI